MYGDQRLRQQDAGHRLAVPVFEQGPIRLRPTARPLPLRCVEQARFLPFPSGGGGAAGWKSPQFCSWRFFPIGAGRRAAKPPDQGAGAEEAEITCRAFQHPVGRFQGRSTASASPVSWAWRFRRFWAAETS